MPETKKEQNRPSANGDKFRWPITFERLQRPPLWLSTTTTVILSTIALFLLLLSIAAIWQLAIDLLGSDRSHAADAVKSILPIAAAAVGLPLIIWRLVILNRQTATAEAKTQIDRETHYTSIFSRSVDQLGQTRELKTLSSKGNTAEAIARTVPNIEVRLGAIHSLTRLADESAKDARKIRSMLISYVRENSWSNRSGDAIVRPTTANKSTFGWSYSYRQNKVTEAAKSAYEEWKAAQDSDTTSQQNWAGSLADNRVDVSEAIEAIPTLPSEHNESNPFYESLFVGRVLKRELLNSSTFDRCVFTNCSFEANNSANLRFDNSSFIGCSITCENSNVLFLGCNFIDCRLSQIENSTLTFRSCDLSNLYGTKIFQSTIDCGFTSFYSGWLSTVTELQIRANYCDFPYFSLRDTLFASGSEFDHCTFLETNFEGADLAEVIIKESLFDFSKANPKTKLPANVDRPFHWPAYDGNFEDDEIPF